MRVGDSTFYMRLLAGLGVNRQNTERALLSLADGKKVRVASDDSTGARESLALRARATRLIGFDRSADAARTSLATLDSALGEVFNVLSEARTEAMAGASAPLDVANDIRADQIERLRESLLSLANTYQGGRYLFGGTETQTIPFGTDGVYVGNADETQAPIDTQEQVGATLDGGAVFTDAVDIFALMTDLAAALRDNRTEDVGALVPELGEALDHVAQVRGDLGFRMHRIDQVLERHADEELTLLGRIGAIEDVDLTEVAVQLQALDTSTSALSAAAVRMLGRSLFDYLG